MRNILIAWELGGGLNHLVRTSALAREFSAKGFHVVVALRDLRHSAFVNWPPGTELQQAPLPRHTMAFEASSNYTEILFSSGYHDRDVLAAMVVGWSQLVERVEPAVVVVDHAPTASLVARLADIPLARMGTGFFAPPAVSPFPPFRRADTVDRQRLQAAEVSVLAAINHVAGACGVAFKRIADAIQPDLDLLTCWPELDHYAGMRPPNAAAEFVFHERISTPAPPVQWPQRGRTRVLAYLTANYSALHEVVDVLRRSDVATVAYILGASASTLPGGSADNFHLREALFDPKTAMPECDVFVCHAGNGTLAFAHDAGKPALMLPHTMEQAVYATRVEEAGAGVSIDPPTAKADFAVQWERFLAQAPQYGAQARALAQRYPPQVNAMAASAAKILALAGQC